MSGVTVVGAGAIGGLVGAKLIAAGHDVTLVDNATAHLEAICRDGLRIRGASDLLVWPRALHPDQLEPGLGTVLLCVKARHTLDALSAVGPLLAEDGCIVSLQNGLQASRIAHVVGAQRTVGACLTFGGHYAAPGEVVDSGNGSFWIGDFDGSDSARVHALSELLGAAHPAEVTDRIFGFIWGKTTLEAFYFGSALADADMGELLREPSELRALGAVVGEVVSVAAAGGVAVEPIDGFVAEAFHVGDSSGIAASWEAQRRYWASRSSARTGIWRDLAERRRPTEVDDILGPVIAAAGERAVPTPGLRRLVELVHEAERVGAPLGPRALDALEEVL